MVRKHSVSEFSMFTMEREQRRYHIWTKGCYLQFRNDVLISVEKEIVSVQQAGSCCFRASGSSGGTEYGSTASSSNSPSGEIKEC